jgi:cytochrome c2
MRLSVLRGQTARIIAGTEQDRWDTLFETRPCIPRSSGPRSPEFHGEESGGKLARLDGSTLLMTVGDHTFDGLHSDTMAAQELTWDYGKTLAIDLESGTSTVFTFGHRNPQGLYVTKSGDIWLTEHGPQGGDELNRLVRGSNYGWPLVTYGTEYGLDRHTWPPSPTPNDHRGFEEPMYSWIPSIAVSSVIALEKNRFRYWQYDLMIGSYAESLFRARIRAGRVVTFEPVRLRSRRGRIRDLFEDRNGSIVVWFDDGTLGFLEPAEPAAATSETGSGRGQTLFAACAGCHALADGATHGIGPDLAGIVNRPVAGSEGFNYSRALAQVPGRWTEQNLDRFLADPQAFAPGNIMLFTGLPDPADRAHLIAYLKQATRRQAR